MKVDQSIPTVVVTDVLGGMGAACALHLDKLGFHVFAGMSSLEAGNDLQQRASNRLTPLLLDVTNATSIAAAAETVAETVGETGLAGLVNSAGSVLVGPLECLPPSELTALFAVNVVGLTTVTQAFLPLLRLGKGRIVNISSFAGKLALPFMGPYTASKFAIEALTDSLRIELRPWDIKVALIEPEVQTDFFATPRTPYDITPKMQQLYGPMLTFIDKIIAQVNKREHPIDSVAESAIHALTAKKPKTRYMGSKPMQWFSLRLFLLLPDQTRDRLLVRAFPTYP